MMVNHRASQEIHELHVKIEKLEAEITRLRTGIQKYLNGDYPKIKGTTPNKCSHQVWDWDTCEGCIDIYFTGVLNHKD